MSLTAIRLQLAAREDKEAVEEASPLSRSREKRRDP